MTDKPELPLERLREFCQRWKITELAVFGSYLRDDFTPESDIDLLATWADDSRWSLFDIVRAQQELAEILGHNVDLVSRSAIEQSKNWIRREHILATARTVYAA